MSGEKTAELIVEIVPEEANSAEIDDLTYKLKNEINELNVDSINTVSDKPAPEGTKAVDWAALGQLAVTLAPTIIPSLFDLVKNWITRKPATPVSVKIKIKQGSAELVYDPAKTSPDELVSLVSRLKSELKT